VKRGSQRYAADEYVTSISKYFLLALLVLGNTVAIAQESIGCPQPRGADLVSPSPEAQNFKFSEPDLELLRQVDALDQQIADHGLLYVDPEVEAYIQRIGCSVVPAHVPERVTWRFRVLRDPVPNAFALANGSVYINTGMLSRLENEAQLAGVLAHEVTHVVNRHTYRSFNDMRRKYVMVDVFQAATSAAPLAGANGPAMFALGNLVPLAVVQTTFGYRRELEHDADVYAVRLLAKAGYDPKQMAHALDLLRHGPEVDLSVHPIFWADHPRLEARVKDTTALAEQLQGQAAAGRIEDTAYTAATRNAIRHDANLDLILGRPRTAVAIAKRLISLEPNNAEYYALLGDAYRALGGRSPEPKAEELTNKGKDEARKKLRDLTPTEYEKALLARPGGLEQWHANSAAAERAFARALELDSKNPAAHRGLGFLYEDENRPADAITQLKTYLELAPEARDAHQVELRIESLQRKSAVKKSATEGSQ
jgi:beta-barrel assembly-enhancing protease